MKTKVLSSLAAVCLVCAACDFHPEAVQPPQPGAGVLPQSLEQTVTPRGIALVLSQLPIGAEQIGEVHDAVDASSGNGYDEEYTMERLFRLPGSGVGDAATRAAAAPYERPLRDLFSEYFRAAAGTRDGSGRQVEDYVNALIDSGMQIYWPYSEDWDGKTTPLITYDPGYSAESNYAYEIRIGEGGAQVVDSVVVDEALARTRPVWVVNHNDDSGFTPMDFYLRDAAAPTRAGTSHRRLILKDFTMLRNYDSWFGGASEFIITMGRAKNFKADDDLNTYHFDPSITTFTIVVKRKQVGLCLPLETMLMGDLGSDETFILLITEDDGGTRTTWKCEMTVKYNSKSYGIELGLPLNQRDDIVWRGPIHASYFQQEDIVHGRFGDVQISFELE